MVREWNNAKGSNTGVREKRWLGINLAVFNIILNVYAEPRVIIVLRIWGGFVYQHRID